MTETTSVAASENMMRPRLYPRKHPMADTIRIRLLHSSSAPGASGNPGDIIDCPTERALRWLADVGAAELVEQPKPPAEVTPEPPPADPPKYPDVKAESPLKDEPEGKSFGLTKKSAKVK